MKKKKGIKESKGIKGKKKTITCDILVEQRSLY